MAVTPTQLNQFLNQHFSLGELRTLCFELGISYEDLEGGESRAAKVLALVQYVQRHGLYDAVVTHAQAARPNARMGDMPATAQPAANPQTTVQTPTAPVYITVHGNLTGGAFGEHAHMGDKAGGDIQKNQTSYQAGGDINVAGRDINIGHVPQNRDEFAAQLKELEALLQQAIAAKELPTAHDAETLVEDLQDVVKEAKAEQPRRSRITRRLEDMTEIVDSAGKVAEAAGKTGAFMLKAAPILAGLAKAVQMLF